MEHTFQIVSPTECPAEYFNRKGWHSIIMQRMVENTGRFYGGVHWVAGKSTQCKGVCQLVFVQEGSGWYTLP